ncbi:hypothetical protein JCM30394_22580 [Deferrisoma palaeochoriense]
MVFHLNAGCPADNGGQNGANCPADSGGGGGLPGKHPVTSCFSSDYQNAPPWGDPPHGGAGESRGGAMRPTGSTAPGSLAPSEGVRRPAGKTKIFAPDAGRRAQG